MIATHYAAHCDPPWLAVDMAAANKLLAGYRLSEAMKTDLAEMMAHYCRLIDEAGLCHYGTTEAEAVAAATGGTCSTPSGGQQACPASLWTVGVGDEVEYHPGTIAGKRTLHKITRAMPTRVVVNGYTFRRDTGFRYGASWSCASIRVPNGSSSATAGKGGAK